MDCNCININNGGAVFRHVYGNVLRMAIPLTVRTVELVDGEATATDADFIPSQDYPVEVVLQRENRRAITIEATMRDGNIAYIEDLGTVPVGQYAITVMCKDDNGNPYRFKQNDVLNVVDTTAEAGIEKGIEYDVTVWYLDSAIYLVLKGEDGVGIEDIVTETSDEIGGTNTITIVLSDGRQKSFTVMNGSGAVDGDFNPNSNHPVSNSVITERFNAVDTAIAGLFGDVDYDSQTKSIRFYNKNKSAILATLDAKPFIKDGMVNSVYISNNTLVITFNTDAGREAIGVPLTSVFNPNNYYTKVQVDSRIATALDNLNLSNYYTKSQTDRLVGRKADVSNDGKVPVSEATPVVLDYIYAPAPGPVIPINPQAGEVIYFANEKKIRRYYHEDAGQSGGLPAIVYVEETPSKHVVYYNKGNEKFYRYDAGLLSMVEIETGRGDGTVTGVKVGSTTYEPTDGVVDISASIPDVDTAIAGLADVARTGDYDDLENKPTIPDVSNLATKSELQSKADASNVYTKSEVDNALALKQGNITDLDQIRAGATLGASSYQKPHSGIPASDLADGVIPDVSGFVTASDVADAVADLVDSAPATLDTLKELADALGDDPNFATTVTTALGNKVDKVSGKGLSTEDYTTAEKTKLANLATVATTGSYNDLTDKPVIPEGTDLSGYYDKTEVDGLLDDKVDKVSGKGLSTNDYTDAEKTKLAGLSNYDDTALQAAVAGKVDKESGKSLMTDSERTKLAGIASGAEVNVQADWEQTTATADDYIKNKPDVPTSISVNQQSFPLNNNHAFVIPDYYTKEQMNSTLADKANTDDLADVATSGSYNDLTDKPSIPAPYDDTALAGRVSALESAGYITTETDPTVPNWAKQPSKPTYTPQEVGALPSTTPIPSKTSDLTNDSGFINKAMYYGTSDTAASTMPKVCTVETFPTTTANNVTHAKDGTIIAVKFTNSDTNTTAAPTLNVNDIGAKGIMYNNAIVTSTAKNTTVAGTAKMLAYYRYDSSLDSGNGAWEYLGKSVDSNSTYTPLSLGFGYASQSNSSASATITAALSSYTLTSNGIVSVKFTYDVPANATLNINSKGAKAIYNQGAPITAGVIKAGDVATFIYSTYYHLISVDSWQDKQDAIDDLATIRSGAAAGATAVQSSDLATVATTGTYSDLSGKPSLATVATSGSYNDLSNKPTLFSGNYNDLTNKPTIPDVSGLATKSEVATGLATKQDTLTFDNEPTANSNNPVKSGGIKQAIDEKLSQVTVNAIPAGSVAVIDGYYSDSATDVLSAGKGKDLNDRLVEVCGGIVYEERTEEVTTDVQMTAGKYIATNQGVGQVCPMTENSYAGDDCAVINLNAGETLEIIGVGGNGSRLWTVLDKSTHVIQSVADANTVSGNNAVATPFTKTITAETDCIVIVNVYNDNVINTHAYGNLAHTPYSVKLTKEETIQVSVPTDGILGGMQDTIEVHEERINEIAGGITYINTETEDVQMTTGKYITANQGVGQVCPMTESSAAGNDCAIVNLGAGETLDIVGVGGNSSRLWAILDKTTHVIQSVADANTATGTNSVAVPFTKTITAATDCIVVVNVYNANQDTSAPAYGNQAQTPYSVKLTKPLEEPIPVASEGLLATMQESIDNNTEAVEEHEDRLAALEQGDNSDKVFEMTNTVQATAAAYHQLWDGLVNSGKVVRSTIATPNNKPVYLYHIAPNNKIVKDPTNQNNFTISDNDYFQKKKVLITTGIHGDERQTPLWVFEFFNRILTDDKYASFRSAYEWYVVPLVNPTGYDNDNRLNYNGANINRDFHNQTQVETQAVCDLIDTEGFYMYIDCHQFSGGRSTHSPTVCSTYIPPRYGDAENLQYLCTLYTKGAARATAALNKHFNKTVEQSGYAWTPVSITEGQQQSHDYGFEKGIAYSMEFEISQFCYAFSGSDTRYNPGSYTYGNTMLHYLMMEFLN